jgi:L-alanine-DL-glutamate epimerase-like enolase superfamily enzyme
MNPEPDYPAADLVLRTAIGAVVNAAWDLAAKRAGQPVWQFWLRCHRSIWSRCGGSTRGRGSHGIMRKCGGTLPGEGQTQRRAAVFALVRELARGLEPLTCCFSAGSLGSLGPNAVVWHRAW